MTKAWGIIDIHGTAYHTVAKRVADFRGSHKIEEGWQIHTEIVKVDIEHVIAKAQIIDPTGRVVATGHAQEQIGAMAKGMGASILEVAETSAVGRAMAFAGFGGAQSDIASADEMTRRTHDPQVSKVKANQILRGLVAKADADDPAGCLEIWDELNQDQQLWVMHQLDRVNVEKVNACLKTAQERRDGKVDERFIAPLPLQASEKDKHRAGVRSGGS